MINIKIQIQRILIRNGTEQLRFWILLIFKSTLINDIIVSVPSNFICFPFVTVSFLLLFPYFFFVRL